MSQSVLMIDVYKQTVVLQKKVCLLLDFILREIKVV